MSGILAVDYHEPFEVINLVVSVRLVTDGRMPLVNVMISV